MITYDYYIFRQILPALSKFLINSAKESYKKDSKCIYKYTQTFKLQREILSQLGSIVKNLKFLEKDTWDILDTLEPYLDCLQHLELQVFMNITNKLNNKLEKQGLHNYNSIIFL
jgi:hypothetical protein